MALNQRFIIVLWVFVMFRSHCFTFFLLIFFV